MPERLRYLGNKCLLLGLLLVSCNNATPRPTDIVYPSQTPSITPTETPTLTSTLVVPTSTPTRTITPTPLPTFTPTPKIEDTVYYKIRNRLKKMADQERNHQKIKNPTRYSQQIDPALENIGPTFLVLGCGDDYVSSATRKQKMCANSEFILGEKQIKRFNLTHDTGFPKQPGVLVRSDELWMGKDGGFSALRDGWQNATRAPVDFIIVISDYTAIGQLVDTSFGGKLKVNVPLTFTAQPIWLDGKPTNELHFKKGVNELSKKDILQYLAATPNTQYPPELENHVRVQHVLDAMIDEVNTQKMQGNYQFLLSFLLGGAGFATDQLRSGNIVTDSDLPSLTKIIVETAGTELISSNITGKPIDLSHSKLMAEPLYLLDPAISPNGVKGLRWGTIDDPFMKKHIQSGGADSGYFEIPDWNKICQTQENKQEVCGANFFTDRPERDYWPPVNKAFKDYVLR